MSLVLAVLLAFLGLFSIAYHAQIAAYVIRRIEDYWSPVTRKVLHKDFKAPRWIVPVNSWGMVFLGFVFLAVAYALVFGPVRI